MLSRALAITAVVACELLTACDIPRRPTGPDGTRVDAVVVVPATVVLDPLQAYQFRAFGLNAAGDSVAASVEWSASAGTITEGALFTADSTDNDGVVTATLTGAPAISATASVRKRRIAAIVLTPASVTLQAGGVQQFTARGVLNTGDTVAVSANYSATGGAVTSGGLYTAGSTAGSYRVIAARPNGSLADTAAVTITSIPVAAVAVNPASASVPVGQTVQLTATPQDANGNPLSGRTVTWATSDATVATVSGSGMVSGAVAGTAMITASSEGQNGTAAITVTVPPVASVSVSPTSATVLVGQTVQLTATPEDANGSALIGRVVTWASSVPGDATVSASGLVTAVAAGTAMLTATSEGQSGTATVTTTAVPVALVTVTPASTSLFVGQTTQLSVTTKDSAGNVLTGRTITWASSSTTVATVSAAGLVTAKAAGSGTITATSEGKNGTATVTVTIVPVASVAVSPASASMPVAQTVQLSATTKDSAGNVLTGRVVTWASSAPAVATVSASGLVTGAAAGSATLTATSEGKNGTATVAVTIVPVASVTVSPAPASVTAGQTVQLTATPKDASGNPLSGRVVTWATSNAAVATVSAGGLVSGLVVGTATITATSEGKSGSATVSVTVGATHSGFYAAPSGTSGGDGSSARPWDLGTALKGGGGRVQPGDTIWLRAGTYAGAFTSSLTGTATAPIVVRQYPGERAIIDGAPSTNCTFTIDGAWALFWGFELTNSNLDRYSYRPCPVYVRNAAHVKVINLVIHDGGVGIFTEAASSDVEIYGCIIYNNGWDSATRSNGHAIYVKNNGPGSKVISDNVMFNQFGLGFHAYSDAGTGALKNLVIEGNVAFNNSILSAYRAANFLIGGEDVADNDVAVDNMLYFSPGYGTWNARLGYSTTLNGTVTFRGNYVVGGTEELDVAFWQTAVIDGNTLMGASSMTQLHDPNTSGGQWSGNVHHRDPASKAWSYQGSAYTFSGWQAATGLGPSDQATAAAPTTPWVFVRPNRFEPGRAHVVVYNWGRLAAVSVDLIGVLQIGDRYEVHNVQDLFGPAVASGTYGGGAITLAMNGVAPPAPIGGSPAAAVRTGPDFDVFIIRSIAP